MDILHKALEDSNWFESSLQDRIWRMQDDLIRKLSEAKELSESAQDPELKLLASEEYTKLKTKLLREDPASGDEIILEIRAGVGGDEAELWAAELFRMYARFVGKCGWAFSVVHHVATPIGGLKEAVALVKGPGVWAHLKYESGVHRVQRVPETEKSGRVHTSAATVAVLPEAKLSEVPINPSDLKIDTFRASGHGGQSVQKTESAVRITHIPTGITASCQDERSQLKNKEKAMKILAARLKAKLEEKEKSKIGAMRRSQIGTGDRSEKIRTFNFPQDRVTDHRIKKSWKRVAEILDGELEPIIESLRDAEAEVILKELLSKDDGQKST
jgi:peptide chain release factor 1